MTHQNQPHPPFDTTDTNSQHDDKSKNKYDLMPVLAFVGLLMGTRATCDKSAPQVRAA